MPLLTLPLALLALGAIPAVLAVYYLRNRFRERTVSSLMLWADARQPREGGRRVQRLQVPLTLLLELLAILLLTLAATDPRVEVEEAHRPLSIVLDNSWSMTAGAEGDTARDRGAEALTELLNDEWNTPVTLITAGTSPQVMMERTDAAKISEVIERWQPHEPFADIDRAVALATELGRGRSRVLVISDRLPPTEPSEGRLRWWAVGEPKGNVAFVNAVRSAEDDRVLLEVLNASDEPVTTTLRVGTGESGDADEPLQLASRERRRLWLQAIKGRPLTARLAPDRLNFDNQVVLQPEEHRPVRVRLDIASDMLARPLRRALEATGHTELVANRADLVVTDRESYDHDEPWVVRFIGAAAEDANPAAYTGPFVFDRSHELTQGVSLDGVIWASDPAAEMGAGRPILMAGNTPLIAERETSLVQPVAAMPTAASSATGEPRREVVIAMDPRYSTLLNSPGFPALVWNLVQWRARRMPGPERANLPLGAEPYLAVPPGVERVTLVGPEHASEVDEPRELLVSDGAVRAKVDKPGTYHFYTNNMNWAVGVNPLSPDESDVSAAASGRVGTWINETSLLREYRSVAWALGLAAVAVLLGHAFWIHRTGRGNLAAEGGT